MAYTLDPHGRSIPERVYTPTYESREEKYPLHQILENRLFHGTAQNFKPGHVITPPSRTGQEQVWGMSLPSRVYATAGRPHERSQDKIIGNPEGKAGIEDAAHWSNTAFTNFRTKVKGPWPRIFEVEPVGHVSHDINLGAGHAVVAEGLRVKKEVPHPERKDWRAYRFLGAAASETTNNYGDANMHARLEHYKNDDAADRIVHRAVAPPSLTTTAEHPLFGRQFPRATESRS